MAPTLWTRVQFPPPPPIFYYGGFKILKKFFIFLIVFILFLLIFSIYGEEIFSLYFPNEKDKIIVTPYFKGQEIYLPITLISSLLNSSFKIEREKIFIFKNSKEFFLGNIGRKECTINEKSYKLLEAPLSINGDVFLPIKSLFSLLGYRVIIKEKNIYIVQIIDEVNWKEERVFFKIKSEDKIEYKSFKLKEPNRLVFDLYNCILIEKGEIFPKISGIKNIRYSQYSTEPYVVRIVLEFSKDFLEPKITSDKGQVVLNFSKEKVEEPLEIKLVDIKWLKNEKNISIDLIFNSAFTYSKGILRYPERIFFDFPNATTLNTNTIFVNESPVEKIRLGFQSINPKILRVVFDLYTSTIFNEEIFTDTLKINFPIEIEETPNREQKTKNISVIIDPGHGGSDPGAIYSNILEKDLNLQVSLKLSKILKDSGYNVILLREKDETISLDDRVKFVKNYLQENILGETVIYLSIHTNAALSPTIKGIEIFYATDFSFPLAKTFSEVLSKYYSVRTLRQGKFYVLSRIPIPGVIVEMGFLSNNEERALLTSEEFQNNFVEKIKEAIEKYNIER
ncbi:MAG: N-acetylmuramoyl-L-alanine amidase family protein [Dictyoglomaceae bacterium]|nr:N-acetylmuramoyl-L-alanine amidase family protein [Dictyoglomaceae bacterium]